jgi:cell division protein FtsA
MYSTCIGLILKGCSDFEHKYKEFEKTFKKVEVPEQLVNETRVDTILPEVIAEPVKVKTEGRKSMQKFWDKFKNNLLELFKEEGDQEIK